MPNSLKVLIESTLLASGDSNICTMLKYMEHNGYYTAKSSTHDHWKGGASQHMWATYLMAKKLRDERISDPIIAKYATDEKLAKVCLLHDLCDMKGIIVSSDKGEDVSHHHGRKSYWIMKNAGVGTIPEQYAVKNHMHSDAKCSLHNPDFIKEYNVLHGLISEVDHIASGSAWNSTRYLEKRTQHLGVFTEDISYQRAVALDRTSQILYSKMYVADDNQLYTIKNFNRNKIQWSCKQDVISDIQALYENRLSKDSDKDAITIAHQAVLNGSKRVCIIAGCSNAIPNDRDTRLRGHYKDEQSILICSNILLSMYNSKRRNRGNIDNKKYRFEFTMRDEIKNQYQHLSPSSGIFFKDAMIFREGESEGYKKATPYTVDILLVPNMKFKAFAVCI